MIEFVSTSHTYTYTPTGEKFISVTSLLDKYSEKQDWDTIAEKKAKKLGITKEELLKTWEDEKIRAATQGTRIHEIKENKILGKPNVVAHREENGIKYSLDITELKPGIYPELILYHPYYKVVGTADYVEIFEDNTFNLLDFKTNKKLEFSGYPVFNKNTFKKEPRKMLSPLNHIDDCNGMKYTLQLSIYSWLLEELGFKLNQMWIEHILLEDGEEVNVIKYPINYLKKEVRNLFEHFKSKQ